MSPTAGVQSAFITAGPEAAAIEHLTWVLVVGSALVFLLVLVLAGLALARPPRWLTGTRAVIVGGVLFPVITLSALLVYSWLLAPRAALSAPADVVIEVIGQQWWWRIHYLDSSGKVDFVTANEMRVPVGQTVEVRLRSADVLHSFWVPALAGKLDLIPGRTNRLQFVAERPGRFRGQRAEYCGQAHALMAMFVLAEAPERFESWRARQRIPGVTDVDHPEGLALFMTRCAVCHTVRGTGASGILGPDLTHFGSRTTLGAGILPNNQGAVAAWITSTQHLKPGNLMPEFRQFSPEELQSLAGFLSDLK